MKKILSPVACIVLLVLMGCRSGPIDAIPDPIWHANGTAMWHLRLDGVPYVFIGGLPGKGADVKKTTSFFLVPADLWDSKRFNPQLQPDGFSFYVYGGFLEGELVISDARIYRLVKHADKSWSLDGISGPLPSNATQRKMLDILGVSLGKEIK